MNFWCLIGFSLFISVMAGCSSPKSESGIASCPGGRFCRDDCRGAQCRQYCYTDGRDVGGCVIGSNCPLPCNCTGSASKNNE